MDSKRLEADDGRVVTIIDLTPSYLEGGKRCANGGCVAVLPVSADRCPVCHRAV